MALVVLAALVLVWIPTWDAPYAEDDYLFLDAVTGATVDDLAGYLTGEGVMDHHYRPLTDPLAFAALRAAFGTWPGGYHLLLLGLHGLSALLVARIAGRLGLGVLGAGVAALLYVTRDLSFPSLVWASGLSDVLSATLALGAVALFLGGRAGGRTVRVVLAGVCLVGAQLAKELAVVTLGLLVLVECVRPGGAGLTGRGVLRALAAVAPYAVAAVPIAVVQWRMARFDEAGGQALYALSFGPHVLTSWGIYLLWSVVGVAELHATTLARGLAVLVGAGTVVVVALRRRGLPGLVPAGLLWFTLAIAPALLAENRVHTSYLALAAVGPVLALAALLTREGGMRLPRSGAILLTGLVVISAGLVHLKDRGVLASGGWVDPVRAERMHRVVTSLVDEVPDPPPGARMVIFGGLGYDLRVLGDPRRAGFGVQQVLPSAIRAVYGRRDLDALSLPPVVASAPGVFDLVIGLVREDPIRVRVVMGERPPRDVTDRVIEVVRRGGTAAHLRAALLPLVDESARLDRDGFPREGEL